MQVVLDEQACIGSGSCEQIAPQVFAMDDDGIVTVIDANPPAEMAADVESAVLNCPTAAITVTP